MTDETLKTCIGYFTDARQAAPTYDPPKDAPCLICERPITPDDVRTISVLWQNGDTSLFYRVHKSCHEILTAEESGKLDGLVLDCF